MSDGEILERFSDPKVVNQYKASGVANFVPGFETLHDMVLVLLSEKVGDDGHILVHGAGGGIELKKFSSAKPNWRLTGVYPAAGMLEQARNLLGPEVLKDRVNLIEGFIESAPAGPFDGATSLLTMHCIPAENKLETLRQIRSKLKPGAPFIQVHVSFDKNAPDASVQYSRYAGFPLARGEDPEQVSKAKAMIEKMLHAVPPKEEKNLLTQAGFTNITKFYTGLVWKGWVAYA